MLNILTSRPRQPVHACCCLALCFTLSTAAIALPVTFLAFASLCMLAGESATLPDRQFHPNLPADIPGGGPRPNPHCSRQGDHTGSCLEPQCRQPERGPRLSHWQTRDVVVYRLITCGTIEEKIYRKQVYKGALSRTSTDEADPFRYFSHQARASTLMSAYLVYCLCGMVKAIPRL